MAEIVSKKKSKRNKYTLTDLKTLGHQLLSSRSHINNLPLLLTFISPTLTPQYVLESLLSLQSFFITILPELPSSASSKSAGIRDSKDDSEFIYKTWLRSKFDEFVKLLIDVAVAEQSEETLKEVVVDTLMEFVKMGKGGNFQSAIYHRFINSIVHSDAEVDFVLNLLVTKYFIYIDVCYFTYISVEKIVRTLEAKDISDNNTATEDANNGSNLRTSMEVSIKNIHKMLSRISALETTGKKSDMWSESGDHKEVLETAKDKQLKTDEHNNVLSVAKISKRMKLKFTKAWISFLRLPLPLVVYKEVLVTLHQPVIPRLSSPIMLCDFLTRSYDIGGVVSIMALSSLFILMTQHGLEYPNFYEKLYALMAPSIFMAKHRAKFFELLDSCLKSPLLPAYLASSFAKRLSRLALSVPPSGALVIIALIHNLLRRHSSINCLVHREDCDESENDDSKPETQIADGADDSGTDKGKSNRKRGIDAFNNEETDPMKSSSMRSSLWEIDTLRHHYCPPVSRFVLSLENDLTVRSKTTEMNVKDFSSGSYATIFGDEIRRRVKQVPLAFYKATPTSLFSDSDFAGWTFKYGKNKENCASADDQQDHGSPKRQRLAI